MVLFFYKGKHKKQIQIDYKGIPDVYHSPAKQEAFLGERSLLSVENEGLKLDYASISMAVCVQSAVNVHLLLACVLPCRYNGSVEIIPVWILIRNWSKQPFAYLNI